MKPETQRVAIAEAHGFERRKARSFQGYEWFKDGRFYRETDLPDLAAEPNASKPSCEHQTCGQTK